LKTAAENDCRPENGRTLLVRLAPAAWVLAVISAIVLLLHTAANQDHTALRFAAVVFAGCGALWIFPFSGRRDRRGLISLFLLAFAVRLAAAVLFDSLAVSVGDPYAGSPDAWSYDLWARRLVSAWSELRGLTLHSHAAAGRWDVGFHYLLAAFYGVFGESILGGRVLVVFFGAAAVVFLYLAARRVAGDFVATLSGLIYAFWISSVAWSGYSVLRDTLVWTLMLLAVWLALKVSDGSGAAAFGLFLALVLLRTVRPYVAILVVAGLGVAGALAAIRRSRGAIAPALKISAAVLAAEVVFFATGFPNVLQMVPIYKPRQVLLKPLKHVPLSRIDGYPVPLPALDGEMNNGAGQPRHLLGPSLPANALRFFLSPPGWAPVRGNISTSGNWQLPGMWLWYAILPVAAFGFFLSLSGSVSLRSIAITAAIFSLMLMLVGRGDSVRQREMVVPIVLLWFAVGVRPALRRPRVLLTVYLFYAAIFGAGILYHRRTLRERGMVRLDPPESCQPRDRAVVFCGPGARTEGGAAV
jgi:hypothetical protein